jgi:hypothetical protein
MPVTLKSLYDKRNKFFMISALLTIFISTMLIITALFLFNFWLNTIIGIIISLFSYITFLFINRIYINKGTLNREIYIQSIFGSSLYWVGKSGKKRFITLPPLREFHR